MIKSFNRIPVAAAIAALSLGSAAVRAQVVVSDTLTGGHSLLNWKALDGACLTAGDNSVTPNDPTQPTGYTPAAPGALTIPKCDNFSYYTSRNSTLVGGQNGTLPDSTGNGALRLTNGDKRSGGSNGDNQTGAVISNFTFPTNAGIQVTWTSVSYGGDNNQSTGADGISFFLSDGSKSPQTAGGLGGSLGYSCSNVNSKYEGLVGGYVGVGIDEFGNFVNSGDNTATGATGGAKPGAIGLRGAGSITWTELQTAYPTYYPTTITDTTKQKAAVIQTCKTGKVYDTVNSAGTSTTLLDYKLLTPPSVLPSTVKLANQQATSTSTDNVPKRSLANYISYSLRITSTGLLDFSYAVGSGSGTGSPVSVLTGFDIKAANNNYVPSSFRFGFSAGTGGGNNVHEITCFKAAPADDSNSSAGSNVQQSAQVVSGTQVFLAYYHPVNSWGQMSASNLVYTAASGSTPESLGTATSANWDASCVLTGGTCPAVSTSTTVTAQAPSARVVLSNDGGTGGGNGVAFTAAALTSAQLTALGDTSTNAPEIAYLRGDRSSEVTNGGTMRNRSGVLGDIVDSSPVWVGYPNSSYDGPWSDKLKASATFSEGTTYKQFRSNRATRLNVVYVGANDGMLHGFEAGSFAAPVGSASPVFDSTNNDGKEVLAYVPAQVVSMINSSLGAGSLDFNNPSYNHNFYVDATPGTGDLYYNGAWHTWLVSGLGPGGHAAGAVNTNTSTIASPVGTIFALDVTDPSATNFKEANASSIVVGEWSSSTIMCGSVNCGAFLGQVSGTPVIRRLHDGTWGVIFGNGTDSTGNGTSSGGPGHSGIFILHIDPSNGNKTWQYIEAGTAAGGGIIQVAATDLDSDHITDYVYAGDVLGNLYRFDLTDTTSSANWSVMKIFQAASNQPISTAPIVAAIPTSGTGSNPKVIVMFGTGQKQPITVTSAETFATGSQALYGIWDANMNNWNATSTDAKYAAVGTSTSTTTAISIASSALQTQTATADSTNSTRTATNATMCWKGMTGCGNSSATPPIITDAMGWTMTLPTSTEQVIYNPMLANGVLFINTTIPATSTALTCQSTDVEGWTMGLSVTNGGAGTVPAFDGDYSGYSLNGAGTPAIYAVGTTTFLGTNTNDHHKFKAKKTNPQPGSGKRLTWTKIR